MKKINKNKKKSPKSRRRIVKRLSGQQKLAKKPKFKTQNFDDTQALTKIATDDLLPIANLQKASQALENKQPFEAFEMCRKILVDEPHNAIALNLAGVAAFQVGLIDDALDLLQTSIYQAPNYVEALTNLGNVFSSLDRFQEAKSAYEQAIMIDPNYIEAHFNFGIMLEKQGNTLEAIASLERVVEVNSNYTLAWHGLGNAYRVGRRLLAAKSAFEKAIEQEINLPETHLNLSAVMHELGEFRASAEQARKALILSPNLPEAQYNLAIALQELGLFEESNELYKKVLEAQPKHAAAAMNLALGYQQLGDLKLSEVAFEQALKIDPDFSKAHMNYADLKLHLGDPRAAVKVCDNFLRRHPGNTELTAFKAIALTDAGDRKMAERVVSSRELLRSEIVSSPPGYKNLADFNSALSAHLRTHPTLTNSPQSHATREGQHSGELLEEPKGAFADLEKLLFGYALNYKKEVREKKDHAFLLHSPEHMKLSIWGVIMKGRGHQLPHIHPAAWLSGVYYTEVPKICAKYSSKKAGWIAFGSPPEHFHNKVSIPPQFIEPKPGLLILFPSYYYHHTIPYHTDENRISIAFDFVAVR